jgi:hypothetical protein
VFYSSVNSAKNDSIEVRINPKNIDQLPLKYNKRMFKTHERLVHRSKENPCPLEVVVHFIKNGKYEYPTPTSFDKVGKMKDGTRDRKYRKDIQKQLNMVLLYNDHNKKLVRQKIILLELMRQVARFFVVQKLLVMYFVMLMHEVYKDGLSTLAKISWTYLMDCAP